VNAAAEPAPAPTSEAPSALASNGDPEVAPVPRAPELPEGVLAVRVGPGANCSSAGSAIDVLFYGSVIVGAIAVALAAAFPPRERRDDDDDGHAAPPAPLAPRAGDAPQK
jgi:hypothetical protein